MKYIKKFETLGLNKSLLDLVNEIKNGLTNNNKFELSTNMNGQDIHVTFEYRKTTRRDEPKEFDSYFEVIDAKTKDFYIKIGNLKKSIIIHELKHLDRALRKDIKSDSYFNIYFIGTEVAKRYKYFFETDDYQSILLKTLYYVQHDEFESYYHEFYLELDDAIDKSMTDFEKRKLISDFLNDQEIYIYYKSFINAEGFHLENFFKNYWCLQQYLKIFLIKANQFRSSSPNYHRWNIIITKIKYILNKFNLNKSEDVDSAVNEFNRYVNKSIYKNFKKFDRLYSLFI